MKWSVNAPTKIGWYWFKAWGGEDAEVGHLASDGKLHAPHYFDPLPLDEVDFWGERLEEPE